MLCRTERPVLALACTHACAAGLGLFAGWILVRAAERWEFREQKHQDAGCVAKGVEGLAVPSALGVLRVSPSTSTSDGPACSSLSSQPPGPSTPREEATAVPSDALASDGEVGTSCECGAEGPQGDEELWQTLLPFSQWAAAEILGVSESQEDARLQKIHEALQTIAALYLRADVAGIVQVIDLYELTPVLLSYLQHAMLDSASMAALDLTTTLSAGSCDGSHASRQVFSIADVVSSPEFRAEIARMTAHKHKHGARSVDLDHSPSSSALAQCSSHYMHVCASRKILRYLMQELEALLTLYLSRHWRSIAAVMEVNMLDLRDDGLVCFRPSFEGARALSVSSAGSHAGSLDSLPAAERARRNWRRAQKAVMKSLAVRFLRPAREFKTLHQMFKELNKVQTRREGHRPVLLFLGGGMAAGKSTVREIIGSDQFWSTMGNEAIVIEADAIKDQDVVYQELMKMKAFEDDVTISEYVHEWSTQKAESMLVTAINQQKDIILDGTCSWAPFVEQTIAMVRDHANNYRRAGGYTVDEAGTVTERYWEIDTCPARLPLAHKQPYRIEMIGVTCNPSLAVARGVWRHLRNGRSVPIPAQLRSFKLFAASWEHYCRLVDSATLYHTGSDLTTMNKDSSSAAKPSVIAHMSESTRGEMLVNARAYPEFMQQGRLCADADGEADLYPCDLPYSEQVMKKPTQLKERLSVLRSAFRFTQEQRHV